MHTADLFLQGEEFLGRRGDGVLAVKANIGMGQNWEMACGLI